MTTKKEDTKELDSVFVQMGLFQSSKKLNLSNIYEAIPKEVSKNDPYIQWVTEYMANPVKKPFSIDGQSDLINLFSTAQLRDFL